MQFKKAIKEILLPTMEREGFVLIDSTTAYYEFGMSDDSIRVVVDKSPWPPSELRVHLHFRNYHRRFSGFDLNQLTEYKALDLFYTNQEELEVCLAKIGECMETHVITLLMHIRDNHVFHSNSMTTALSVNPEKQAVIFANGHSLNMRFELTNFLFAESWIATVRGDIMSKWRLNFDKNTDDIVNLISYYGELLRKKDSQQAKWNWAGDNSYGLEYDEGWRYPISDVIDYWNYGQFIPAFRLVPPALRSVP